MSLPSQSIGAVSGRTHMYRRSRSRRGHRARVLVIPAIIIALGWWGISAFWPDGNTSDGGNAAGDGAGSAQFTSASGGALHGALMDDDEDDLREDRSRPASTDRTLARPEDARVETPKPQPQQPESKRTASDDASDDESPYIITPDASTYADTDDSAPRRGSRAARRFEEGMRLLESNNAIDARRLLTAALVSGELGERTEREIRDTLTKLNERMVFSPEVFPGDDFVRSHTVGSGEYLSTIVRNKKLLVDWRFICRINRIDPRKMREGMNLKLITGPFHVVVDKADYRMDVFLGDDEERVYVCSMPVGLGEFNKTPVGMFTLKRNSKLINPEWINPVTRDRFEANDPMNPIGEHWIGLEGMTESLKDVIGYGIHGTIEPDSIGKQESMGCIRMHSEDVALVYELLVEGASTVDIRAE